MGPGDRDLISRIAAAYDDSLTRAYSWGRFTVLRQCFLDEIGQYLPEAGRILDVGCGFGLFSLYYAMSRPELEIVGIDVNPNRIRRARYVAERLGIGNVTYEVADVTTRRLEGRFEGIYMLDIIHHVPVDSVPPLLARLYEHLKPQGRMVIKDVDTEPAYKRWFTYVLDKMMDPEGSVSYWRQDKLIGLLKGLGFEVYYHNMVDILPYPHVLYICNKRFEAAGRQAAVLYSVDGEEPFPELETAAC